MKNFVSWFKNDIIEFFCHKNFYGIIPEPVPAVKMMPKWFKQCPTNIDNRDHFGARGQSAKKCMPLLDAMSIGFIIPLWGDFNMRTNKTGSIIEASDPPLGKIIEYHSKDQLGGTTSPTYPGDAVKFINHWVVKTAPGYSTLFIPPINHIEPRFTCLGGFVDTDKYPKEVNFPAIWHAKDYDDIVKAGTPLVVAIPIKRSQLPALANVRLMSDDEEQFNLDLAKKLNSRRGVYKNELREPRK